MNDSERLLKVGDRVRVTSVDKEDYADYVDKIGIVKHAAPGSGALYPYTVKLTDGIEDTFRLEELEILEDDMPNEVIDQSHRFGYTLYVSWSGGTASFTVPNPHFPHSYRQLSRILEATGEEYTLSVTKNRE